MIKEAIVCFTCFLKHDASRGARAERASALSCFLGIPFWQLYHRNHFFCLFSEHCFMKWHETINGILQSLRTNFCYVYLEQGLTNNTQDEDRCSALSEVLNIGNTTAPKINANIEVAHATTFELILVCLRPFFKINLTYLVVFWCFVAIRLDPGLLNFMQFLFIICAWIEILKILEAPNKSWGLPAEKHCFTQQMNNVLL